MKNNYINTQEHLVFWTVVTAEFKQCTRLTKLKEFILCFSCALNSKPQIVLRIIVSSSSWILCRETYSAFSKIVLYLGSVKFRCKVKMCNKDPSQMKKENLSKYFCPILPTTIPKCHQTIRAILMSFVE